jgi:hypothetical protein
MRRFLDGKKAVLESVGVLLSSILNRRGTVSATEPFSQALALPLWWQVRLCSHENLENRFPIFFGYSCEDGLFIATTQDCEQTIQYRCANDRRQGVEGL